MKKWLSYFVVVLFPLLVAGSVFSLIYRPEHYEQEVNSFFAAYPERLQRRALRNALKNFIKAREERVANMRAFTLPYEPLRQNLLGHGIVDATVAIVETYKSWLVYRIDRAVARKGESEGSRFTLVSDNLPQYRNSQRPEVLMTFELDEEAMFHQYMKRKLANYPSKCAIV